MLFSYDSHYLADTLQLVVERAEAAAIELADVRMGHDLRVEKVLETVRAQKHRLNGLHSDAIGQVVVPLWRAARLVEISSPRLRTRALSI